MILGIDTGLILSTVQIEDIYRLSNKSKAEGTKIRKERQEYPNKRFDEAIDEKLPTAIKMRAPNAKDV